MMRFQLKPLTVALSLALAMPLVGQAADHSLTQVSHDSQLGVSKLNFVVSLDWDLAKPPSGFDRNYVYNSLRQFARSLYTMTEGLHKIGTVYVYDKSQFLKRADIQFMNKQGRAQASVSGWKRRSNEIEIFTFDAGAEEPESIEDIGKTLAHEIGHYGYGFLDEYAEKGKKSSTDLGNPLESDTPRNTIMNDHLKFTTLSTSSDYADSTTQKTAQWRVYQLSAWEALIQNPANDGETAAGYGGPIRTWFEAFRTLKQAPTAESLKKPTGGDDELQVVYMNEGSLMVLAINQNLTLEQLNAAKQSAKGAVDALNNKAQVAVLAWGLEGLSLYLIADSLGIGISLATGIGIYAIAVLAGALSFLPGGLGGTEAVMGVLLIASGADSATAVAITLLCRIATLWFAVALGGVAVGVLGIRAGRPG